MILGLKRKEWNEQKLTHIVIEIGKNGWEEGVETEAAGQEPEKADKRYIDTHQGDDH